jgi:hypothetical protein
VTVRGDPSTGEGRVGATPDDAAAGVPAFLDEIGSYPAPSPLPPKLGLHRRRRFPAGVASNRGVFRAVWHKIDIRVSMDFACLRLVNATCDVDNSA